MNRSCSDCGKQITAQSKSGRCRACGLRHNLSDPEVNARRIANMTKTWAQPEQREKRRIRSREAIRRKIEADPGFAEMKRQQGKRLAASRAGTDGRPAGHESRIRAGKSISKTRMGWCPEEWRPQYNDLIRRKGLKRAQAKAIIEDEIRRAEQAKSPFERQMEALKNGAQLIEKPVLRSRDYEFSLHGGSLG